MQGFHQLILQPTHLLPETSFCNDLIFNSQPNLIVDIGAHPSLHSNCHHQITYCKLRTGTPFGWMILQKVKLNKKINYLSTYLSIYISINKYIYIYIYIIYIYIYIFFKAIIVIMCDYFPKLLKTHFYILPIFCSHFNR